MILVGASAFAVAYSAQGPAQPEVAVAAEATPRTVSIITGAPAPGTLASTDAVGATGSPRARPASVRHGAALAAANTRWSPHSSPRPGHGELILADQQLRRAYARAISAGVPRPILVDYRNRWAGLRHEAIWRPERVVVGYRTMAGDLTRLSQPRRHYGRREARAW